MLAFDCHHATERSCPFFVGSIFGLLRAARAAAGGMLPLVMFIILELES